jgi:VanZ family protein
MSRVTRRVVVVLFWLLVAFTAVEALVPVHRALHLFSWDKLEHALAFGVLTLVALQAFPRRNAFWIGISLSAFGAAIEILQALPFIGRDGDVRDWIADTIAVVLILTLFAVGRRVIRAF